MDGEGDVDDEVEAWGWLDSASLFSDCFLGSPVEGGVSLDCGLGSGDGDGEMLPCCQLFVGLVVVVFLV